jgi:hypothetical protein
MAAAISPADRTLNLVISVSPSDAEAKHFGVCFGNEWSDRRFKLNICSWSFTAARGRLVRFVPLSEVAAPIRLFVRADERDGAAPD